MSSILKVDQIQLADGSAATTAGLGLTTSMPTGSVLQVVQSKKTNTQVIDADAYTDVSDLSVSITPSSTNSKILVMVTVSSSCANNGGSFFRIARGSTAIALGTDSNSNPKTSFEVDNGGSPADGSMTGAMNWLDSPSTTSATTYKLQGKRGPDSAGRLMINRSNNYPASTSWDTNSVSSITVMEIAG